MVQQLEGVEQGDSNLIPLVLEYTFLTFMYATFLHHKIPEEVALHDPSIHSSF